MKKLLLIFAIAIGFTSCNSEPKEFKAYVPPGFKLVYYSGSASDSMLVRKVPSELEGLRYCKDNSLLSDHDWSEDHQRSWDTGGYELIMSYSDGDSCVSRANVVTHNGNFVPIKDGVAVEFWKDENGKDQYEILEGEEAEVGGDYDDSWKAKKYPETYGKLKSQGWKIVK